MPVSFPYLNLTLTVLMDTGGTYSVFSDDLSHFSFTHTNMQVVSVFTQTFASFPPVSCANKSSVRGTELSLVSCYAC